MSVTSNYSGGCDLEDCVTRPDRAKKFVRPHLNGKKLGRVLHVSHPNSSGKQNRMIVVQAAQNKWIKKSWRLGPSGRVPA
jgi:hypothetical protein